MLRRMRFCVILLCALAAVASAAAQPAPKKGRAKPKRRRRPHPAFQKAKEDPSLPRVLLIGDSISIGYTFPTRKLLAGRANVLRIPANGGPTTRGLQSLGKWLAIGKLDVIHFNFGLHDCRIMRPKDKPMVPIEAYEKNLRQIVAKLKKNGAKLIWATTTAVVDGERRKRRLKDVEAYNAVARRIMEAEGIPINDLYAALMATDESKVKDPGAAKKGKGMTRQRITKSDGTHFTPQGYQLLARHVAAAVTDALGAR